MAAFVVGESVFTDESLEDYEALYTFLQVAEERGHSAPSVVVDQDGRPVTHPAYSDRMGAAHLRAGLWAFSRETTAESLGLPTGTDWVRDGAAHMMFSSGSPYRPVPHFYSQPYVQRFGDPQPHLLMPVSSAGVVAFSSDGSRLCTMEERLGHLADGTGAATFVLWEYELALGKRRMVAGFPHDARLGLVELSYSHDGAYILVCDWGGGRNLLVRVSDGLVITLPARESAMAWNPRAGAGCMVVMRTDRASGRLLIEDYDLATDRSTLRAEIAPPHGIPVEVRHLTVSVDERALVTANVGVYGTDLLARGGVHIAASVDLDTGTIEPLLPVRFQTPGAERRHTSPRWCEDITTIARSPITIADHLMESGRLQPCEPDPARIAEDSVRRWSESAEGILSAWETGRLPRTALAQDFAQYMISCNETDADSVAHLRDRLEQLGRLDPDGRRVQALIRTGHRLAFRPIPEQPPETALREAPGLNSAAVAALDLMISATTTAQILPAVRAIVSAAHRAGRVPGAAWEWLAEASAAALRRRDYELAARIALAMLLWVRNHMRADRAVTSYGLGPVDEHEATAITLNGFEACTHLSARTVLGRTAAQIFDAEDIRLLCRGALTQLPVDHHVATTKRSSTFRHGQAPPDIQQSSTITGKGLPFISYLHEDADVVATIARRLAEAGVEVWRDRSNLRAGELWRRGIARAIRDCSHFVVCFSSSYGVKHETYMDDEIRLALSELRLMNRGRGWFVPVLLDDCRIPAIRVSSEETIADLHFFDFHADPATAMRRLIETLRT
ncbi:hypothetical protein F4553_001353 [Allocatelliglobosispora scoriae]|uniref:TIR domain-containing protein n=1 Tax=Allocatelliglobosispora scoriae TaxID=643052 RepID=A0A841BI76_9ACTN|nr:toll/interleukin-1 receptor domain-containing protein [Allocatelliglobosispora scoriae]MBB5867974.1 hypothetical protein [Allocatelliglobosispora scoriae]